MADDVEQAAGWRAASFEVVGAGGVDVALPEVGVFLGEDAVVYAGEFAVYAVDAGGGYACVGWG